MYFITAIAGNDNSRPGFRRPKRTFGYASELSIAQYYVNENVGSMHECLYDYIVIENIGPGIHPESKQEWWYEWNGGRWMTCEKPDWSLGRVNWALG